MYFLLQVRLVLLINMNPALGSKPKGIHSYHIMSKHTHIYIYIHITHMQSSHDRLGSVYYTKYVRGFLYARLGSLDHRKHVNQPQYCTTTARSLILPGMTRDIVVVVVEIPKSNQQLRSKRHSFLAKRQTTFYCRFTKVLIYYEEMACNLTPKWKNTIETVYYFPAPQTK